MPLMFDRAYTLQEFITESGFGTLENSDQKTEDLIKHLFDLHNLLKYYLQNNETDEVGKIFTTIKINIDQLAGLSPKL